MSFFLWGFLSLWVCFLLFKVINFKTKFKKLNQYLYSFLNTITSCRYGNFNLKVKEGVNKLTRELSKNTNAFLESVQDRDKMLKEYIEKERQHQNIKQDFISSLTHDLKVPIIAQDNTYDLFLNGAFGELNKTQRKVISNLKISNTDLKNLVINLLDVQKLDIEDYSPEFEKINLVNFIKQILEQNQSILTIQNKKIHFVFDEKEIYASLDCALFKRVLNNLIANAIYYGKNTENIFLELKKEKNFAKISIKDEGEGIKEEELSAIFAKYYTQAKKYSNVGVGLGLYIVNKIVLAHRGTIKAKNNKDKGATFEIALPLYEEID